MSEKKSGGLAGVIAGNTEICTVGKEGAGLTYRGYDIYDLADNACFEEVAHLLHHGRLPNARELAAYRDKLRSLRALPAGLKQVLESIPADTHPMDVLRTGCSVLGNIEPETDFSWQRAAADRLLAAFPSILLYWHRFHADGTRIETSTDDGSVAGHFLHLLHDARPSELHRRTLDTSLILYAEHEFNASTFIARVITATLSDFHSAITGAIGALRGPLHGGANEAAMELIQRFDSPQAAEEGVRGMLARKELIMGFGHRVYTRVDPRNSVNKRMSRRLAEAVGDERLYPRLRNGRTDHVGGEEAVRQRRLLFRQRLPLHGHPDLSLHAHLRLLAHHRLVGPCIRAARGQQAHPPRRGIHRTGPADLNTAGRPGLTFGHPQ